MAAAWDIMPMTGGFSIKVEDKWLEKQSIRKDFCTFAAFFWYGTIHQTYIIVGYHADDYAPAEGAGHNYCSRNAYAHDL
jgi:hypothetical protein